MNFTKPRVLFLLMISIGFCTTASAKPDKVDGMNVPFGRIPQEIVNNHYPRSYFPGTEKLGAEEMRITALGTGMPNQSPSNVAACFLVELGNGEAFLFESPLDFILQGSVEEGNGPRGRRCLL